MSVRPLGQTGDVGILTVQPLDLAAADPVMDLTASPLDRAGLDLTRILTAHPQNLAGVVAAPTLILTALPQGRTGDVGILTVRLRGRTGDVVDQAQALTAPLLNQAVVDQAPTLTGPVREWAGGTSPQTVDLTGMTKARLLSVQAIRLAGSRLLEIPAHPPAPGPNPIPAALYRQPNVRLPRQDGVSRLVLAGHPGAAQQRRLKIRVQAGERVRPETAPPGRAAQADGISF